MASVFGRLTLTNDVIAGTSPDGACYTNTYVVQDLGGNSVTDDSCLPDFDPATTSSQIVTAEALALGPLGSNGGSTQTIPLGVSSVAIDAGVDASCPPADQRGVPRPSGTPLRRWRLRGTRPDGHLHRAVWPDHPHRCGPAVHGDGHLRRCVDGRR